MSEWTSEELSKIETAEELKIATMRRDGTLRKPVTIWVVRHGDQLYVRSMNGPNGGWFRGTQTRHRGHIRAGPSTPPTWGRRSTRRTELKTAATQQASSLPA